MESSGFYLHYLALYYLTDLLGCAQFEICQGDLPRIQGAMAAVLGLTRRRGKARTALHHGRVLSISALSTSGDRCQRELFHDVQDLHLHRLTMSHHVSPCLTVMFF